MAEFSLDEAYSAPQSGHAFGLDEAYGAKPKLQVIEPEKESNAALAVKGTLGSIAGAGGQLIDMFTGILGGIARAPHYVGTRIATTGQMPSDALANLRRDPNIQGVQSPFGDQKLSAQAASIGAEEVLPEAVHAPFRKIASSLGPEAERHYKENPVGWINEKISEFITEGSVKGEKGSGVPSEDIMQGLDALMTVAGIKGTKYAIKDALQKRDAIKATAAAKEAQLEREANLAAELERIRGNIKDAQTLPAHKQIAEVLGIKSPEQRAAEQRAKRADVKAAFKRPEEGSDYIDIDESIFKAEERARQSTAYERSVEQPDTSTVYDTTKPPEVNSRPFLPIEELSEAGKFREGARILQTPPHERTAVDLARLRRLREGGSANPELLGLLGVAGLGAAAGVALSDDDLRAAVLGGASGAAAALPFMGRGAGVRQIMGQTGAVKGPGGMWHPEAVERLSKPLLEKIALDVGDRMQRGLLNKDTDAALITSTVMQPERMIRNYLNKHAGTPTDPLKDIEIPFGEGTKRWEELTDNVFIPIEVQGPKGLEKQWNLSSSSDRIKKYEAGEMNSQEILQQRKAKQALTSYLSHVGDYLRQNVDPAKLPQYDLVRAVKETAANDARVAKQMEKAATDTTKQLPVYKDYGDGFKWVELKLPEKLTEEQAKGVRKATGEEHQKGSAAYVAVDADGKPIVNSYTQEKAMGATPEEAYLAGRLAEEGNQMGHCVGGYCEGVASGESKIYSLRDAKGKSHVTVEVDPNLIDAAKFSGNHIQGMLTKQEMIAEIKKLEVDPDFIRVRNEMVGKDGIKPVERVDLSDWIKDVETDYAGNSNISQIKGKQNRAPDSKYLPYVQDFVKSGKWGNVGDLGNTGLVKGLDGTFVTKEEAAVKYKKYEENLQNRQQGQINQQLLTGLGAIGLGSLIGSQLSEEPGTGALWGAIAGGVLGLPGARARAKEVIQSADYLGGVISTRLKNVSPELMYRAREFERVNMQRAHDLLNRTVPWMKALNELPKDQRAQLARAVLTNDGKEIAELQRGNKALVDGWREVRNVLTQLGNELGDFGRFKSMKGDYFPRLVKDFEGLMATFDKPIRTRIEAAIKAADDRAMKTRGAPLTDIEISAIVNKELSFQRHPQGHQPGYAKQRTVKEITEQLEPFYHTPEESLFAYIRGAVTDLEMAKFFGKDLVQTEAINGGKYVNIDQSVGNIVGRLIKEGKIDAGEQRQIEDILKSRFKAGERSPNKMIQDVRNLANAGLLGNAVSAATQLGDVAMPIYAQGLRATMTAMARQLTGNAKITAKDFGLADHMAEEFVGASKTATALNKIFRYSGFTMVDRFGKNTMLNAALAKYERLSRTPEGQRQIAAKYNALFGKDTQALINDLRSGEITPNVRALLFSELSDFQPITKLEVPQGYLDNPNGRMMYMLKTFMIKQFDVVRRDAYNEIKAGRVAKGLKNLTGYAITLGVAGASADMVKNWLMGRDVDFTAGDIAENVLKTFGWSEYTRDKAAKEPIKAVINSLLPPFQMMDQILTTDPKAIQYIPVIGKLYYNWELGGKEDAELREAAKAKKEGREFDLSEAAIERRRQKREQAKLKREKEKQQ